MKIKRNHLVYGFIAIIITAALIFSLFYLWGSKKSNEANPERRASPNTKNDKRLTRFDIQLAKQFMDKDRNGQCDVCGMAVKLCIESGQLQCNMDPNSKIGILGTKHIHADWKIYVNGKALGATFFKPLGQKSSFIQVDDPLKNSSEKVGNVLHIQARGVPLWLFFESIGGKFDKTHLIIPKEQRFFNTSEKKLKFYVNGVPNDRYGNYVPNNFDKILISYGNVNEDIQEQINSVTNFAKDY